MLLQTGSSQRAALRMIDFFHLCTHTVTFSEINLSVNLLGGLIYILTKTGLSHQRRKRENEASLKRINLCHRPRPPRSCVTLTDNRFTSFVGFLLDFLPPCAQETDNIMASLSLTVKLFVPVVIKAKGMENKAKKNKKNTRRERPHSSHGKHVEKRIFFFCRFFLRASNRRCGFKV